eukprot:TRINITY_DN5557_c0_g1_i2.p1 TRINITY_DN5557_c0_g1~~TRINITY_DN5557_c0_g1_i2.p1  ORF type:complete len:518 (+),score=165.91 TRINITY_DN5557_c0_g1_i2:147-1700(+)
MSSTTLSPGDFAAIQQIIWNAGKPRGWFDAKNCDYVQNLFVEERIEIIEESEFQNEFIEQKVPSTEDAYFLRESVSESDDSDAEETSFDDHERILEQLKNCNILGDAENFAEIENVQQGEKGVGYEEQEQEEQREEEEEEELQLKVSRRRRVILDDEADHTQSEMQGESEFVYSDVYESEVIEYSETGDRGESEGERSEKEREEEEEEEEESDKETSESDIEEGENENENENENDELLSEDEGSGGRRLHSEGEEESRDELQPHEKYVSKYDYPDFVWNDPALAEKTGVLQGEIEQEKRAKKLRDKLIADSPKDKDDLEDQSEDEFDYEREEDTVDFANEEKIRPEYTIYNKILEEYPDLLDEEEKEIWEEIKKESRSEDIDEIHIDVPGRSVRGRLDKTFNYHVEDYREPSARRELNEALRSHRFNYGVDDTPPITEGDFDDLGFKEEDLKALGVDYKDVASHYAREFKEGMMDISEDNLNIESLNEKIREVQRKNHSQSKDETNPNENDSKKDDE